MPADVSHIHALTKYCIGTAGPGVVMAQCTSVVVVLGYQPFSPIHGLGCGDWAGLITSAAARTAAVGVGELVSPRA